MSYKAKRGFDQIYRQQMLRGAVLSVFGNVIMHHREKGPFTLQQIADRLGVNKSSVSRAFSSPPNWTIDRIADVADALGVELKIEAVDRKTGVIFRADAVGPVVTTASPAVTVFQSPQDTRPPAAGGAPPRSFSTLMSAAA